MRIIAGQLKGRTLRGPVGPGVRPTSDRLRETLFNVLREQVQDARVLDGYAGTGAVGLEALSRGAKHVTFVEQDRRTVAVLGQNIATCGVAALCYVIHDTFIGVTRRHRKLDPFDLVFVDPPYETPDLDAGLAETAALVRPAGLVVLEHAHRRQTPEACPGLVRQRLLTSGDSALSFYAPAPLG